VSTAIQVVRLWLHLILCSLIRTSPKKTQTKQEKWKEM